MTEAWKDHADLRAIVALVEALAQARAEKQAAELRLEQAKTELTVIPGGA